MWTLGFDSTASTVTAALMKGGQLFAVYSSDSATSHSTTLLPAAEQLLRSAGITVRDLGLICCSAGPGSFTGVRIGVATAKGLASPFGIPCVGVSSLEAMAYMYTELPCAVCPLLGARRGNVYTAVFVSDGKGKVTRCCPDDLVAIADLPAFIMSVLPEEYGGRLYLAGDSITEAFDVLSKAETPHLSVTPKLLTLPNGFGAASCGMAEYAAAEDKSSFAPEHLVPVYLRKSQAEREKEESKKS